MYTIKLGNGLILGGLEYDNGVFKSATEISEDIFSGALHDVEINYISSGPDDYNAFSEGYYLAMRMSGFHYDSASQKWCFELEPVPDEVAKFMRINARLNYLAMMTDVNM